ncbi:protein FAN-like isoform X2 [Toxorhynchites rutilus septentrionalis]|uniref:protein FAN-like isoform X2 n=1 Tax=Toxorhynchites rutilus septentrionalis TaxID=329112 RepID=UPI002479BF5C|nr:protein FAN-like isoform X2 [Toxorhynchites rutilus septentrionalis]
MEKERFSLLLLEPGEIYFEDFSVDLLELDGNSSIGTTTIGRLKMCSKSVVFEAKENVRLPLAKIAYKDCLDIRRWESHSLQLMECNVLAIECSQYTEMLNDNVVQPYRFIQERRMFLFNFHYAALEDYIRQLCQLQRASTLAAYEQNSMIATIVFSRHNRVKFNPFWLDNLYEKICVDYQVDQINPLVVNPGRLLLTNAFVYFQPYNNINPYPVLKIRLKAISSFIKRRFLLRHVGLEIKWSQADQREQQQLLYVSFRNQSERDDFYGQVTQQGDFSVVEQIPESITLKWQNGLISNYDYLLYLNSLADRTYQDLTQYPVFPWVISDYSSERLDLSDPTVYRDLSKPIGALNEERLRRLRERCEEMGEPKFLYGSHYSAPGLVLFYLVRKHPKLMLCLQNGRFDHPDRMFNKVEDVYNNCLNNMADFKELIPEFYDTETKGDFLLNRMKINFGQRFDGVPVNHVALPKWTEGSPERFVETLRAALESDYVSSKLHHWIDLIFGCKQRGDEALKADNLFYHLCYEGSVDLDQIKDLASRHALEVQISEFGQIPKQLFRTAHVSKLLKVDTPLRNLNAGFPDNELRIELDVQYFSHKDEITSLLLDEPTESIITTSKDGTFKCYSLSERRQIRSVQISDMPLSAIRLIDEKSVILSCWDNSLIIYNLDYGKITQAIPAHDDAVSCLSRVKESGLLVSGSWDCSVKIWNDFQINAVIGYLPLEDKIASLDTFQSEANLSIVVGTESGEVFLWTLRLVSAGTKRPVDVESQEHKLVVQHRGGVCAANFNRNGTLLVSCGEDRMFNIVDIDTGMVVFKREMPAVVGCLSWTKDDTFLLMADRTGVLHVWNMLEGIVQKEFRVHSDCVYCVGCTHDGQIVTSGKDERDYCVKIWRNDIKALSIHMSQFLVHVLLEQGQLLERISLQRTAVNKRILGDE